MNMDAVVLALLAVADFALIVHLRQRQGQRARLERMMASLCMAVRRENVLEALPPEQPLLPAS